MLIKGIPGYAVVFVLYTGTSAAVLPICLSNFKAIRQFKVPISRLRLYEILRKNVFSDIETGAQDLNLDSVGGEALVMEGLSWKTNQDKYMNDTAFQSPNLT